MLINNRCEEQAEIHLKLAESNRCVGVLHGIIKSNHLSSRVVEKMYQTIFRPTTKKKEQIKIKNPWKKKERRWMGKTNK